MPSPIEILKKRLAAGEVTLVQYKAIEKELCAKTSDTDNSNKVIFSFEELQIFETFLLYEGKRYALDSITRVFGWQQAFSLNYIPTSKLSVLVIVFSDKQTITLTEHRAWFGGKRHKEIGQMMWKLRKLTFGQRFRNLVGELRRRRKLLLFSPKIAGGKGDEVYLHLDGTITAGSRTYNLKDAKKRGQFVIGTNTGSMFPARSSSNPYEVTISSGEKKFGLFSDILRFDPNIDDVDLVHGILRWLAEPDNALLPLE